jgi:hypothetical protein
VALNSRRLQAAPAATVMRICDGGTGLIVHCHARCDSRDLLHDLRRQGMLELTIAPSARALLFVAHHEPAQCHALQARYRAFSA